MSPGAPRPPVEFFFYLSCPWTYLAFVRLMETAMRTAASVVYRPLGSPWLVGEPPHPLERCGRDPAIRAYAAKDLADWARFCSLKITVPEAAPATAEWAQRGAVLAAEAGVGRRYLEAMFHAAHVDGRNLADRGVVLEIAAACGLGGADFEARLRAEATLAALRANGEALRRRGGFASPSMCLGDDLFFGHARMPLLEMALMRVAERPFVAPGEHGRT